MMKIFVAKSFFRISDIEYNYKKIIEIYDKSLKGNCDLLIFSQMAITGYPVYDRLLSEDFLDEVNKYIEKIIDHTKNKKTQILLGCPYYLPYSEVGGVIKNSKLFNSVILINNGYIDSISKRNNILKDNIFNDYKYFDNEVVLNNINNDKNNFDVLISDDIKENKNIFFIKDRDTDFIICLDSEINKNMETKKAQLIKIAKWTQKNIIYLNNLNYDVKNYYSFLGEVFLIDKFGCFFYKNIKTNEDILKFQTIISNGEICFEKIKNNEKNEENFVNLIARNYSSKNIIFEVGKEDTDISFEDNITTITFDKDIKNKKVKFIDYKDYTNDLKLSKDLKELIIQNIYENYILYNFK